MPIPKPEPGLVISYAYLWHHEHEAGQEEGGEDRPSVIVLAVEREIDGATLVTVPNLDVTSEDIASLLDRGIPLIAPGRAF